MNTINQSTNTSNTTSSYEKTLDPSNLYLDLDNQFIRLWHANGYMDLDLESKDFLEEPDFIKKLEAEFQEKNIDITKVKVNLILSNKYLAFQTITLPEDAPEKERLTLLNIELDSDKFGQKFTIIRLATTFRDEAKENVCDYLICGLQKPVALKLKQFTKKSKNKLEITDVYPSFYKYYIRNEAYLEENQKILSAILFDDRTEIILWQLDDPVSLSALQASGDPASDINRFLDKYNEVYEDTLSIDKVKLFGPNVENFSTISFSIDSEKITVTDQELYQQNLEKIHKYSLLEVQKLPRKPIVMNRANKTSTYALGLALILLILTVLFQLFNMFTINREYKQKQSKASTYERIVKEKQKYSQNLKNLKKEKDFYLSISRRRTPWNNILTELSNLTPNNLWFEKVSAGKDKITLIGKAVTTSDISALSVNLNYNSQYFTDAQIVGTRDYEDRLKFKEFQLDTKLKSPTTQTLQEQIDE